MEFIKFFLALIAIAFTVCAAGVGIMLGFERWYQIQDTHKCEEILESSEIRGCYQNRSLVECIADYRTVHGCNGTVTIDFHKGS